MNETLPLCYHVVDNQHRGIPGVHILIDVYEVGKSDRKKFQALTDWQGYASFWYPFPVVSMDEPRTVMPASGECLCAVFVLKFAPSPEAPWKYINITFPVESIHGAIKLVISERPRVDMVGGFDCALMSCKKAFPEGDIWDLNPTSPSVVSFFDNDQATNEENEQDSAE